MGQERRLDPRFPFAMKAFLLDVPGRTLETGDLSAGGAYIVGDLGAETGAILWLHLELATSQRGRDSMYPLDAEVQVMRLTRDLDGTVTGCGVRWLSVACSGDMAPLRHFLKAILSVSSGFVQAMRPREEGATPTFVFVFPRTGETREGPEPVDPVDVTPPDPDADLITEPTSPKASRTGIYVMLPITYDAGAGEPIEGRAIKLLPHTMRVSTSGELPDPYRRVTVRIAVKSREKPSVLALHGTVTTVRRGTGDGQFEVEFSLGNEPDAIATYRRILDQLSRTLQKPA
ncbi:MAG: PilZ domain-containing protein [Deltaproteobacteria bacterium]|nr:PilZ domain-containing protein [Deltaproteobacteria bacterium]